MTELTLNTEYDFINNDCEIFNCRIYKDGGAKIENVNMLQFFESISQLCDYMMLMGLKIKEILG